MLQKPSISLTDLFHLLICCLEKLQHFSNWSIFNWKICGLERQALLLQLGFWTNQWILILCMGYSNGIRHCQSMRTKRFSDDMPQLLSDSQCSSIRLIGISNERAFWLSERELEKNLACMSWSIGWEQWYVIWGEWFSLNNHMI